MTSDPDPTAGTAPPPETAAPLHDRMGIEIVEVEPERVVGRMPVDGNTQPYGLLHGGASCVLAEGLGSIAAAVNAPEGLLPVGIELNATHHRSARTGWVTGVATPIHRGRTIATYEIVVSDEQDRRLCTARLTCVLRPAQALGG
jgi:1,4-dihydroxy-2-naphthoyl-CoA hydrolase